MNLEFGIYLVDQGAITAEQLTQAIKEALTRQRPISQLALRERKLRMNQVYEIFRSQAGRKDSFGNLAIEAGYLKPSDLAELLYAQSAGAPSISQILVEQGVILTRNLAIHRQTFQEQIVNQTSRIDLSEALVARTDEAGETPGETGQVW